MLALASWREVGDPLIVLRWPWGFFCGVWCRWIEWDAERQIEAQRREIEREQQRMRMEARGAGRGW